MIEHRDRAGLVLEPARPVGVRREFRWQDLDRDVSPEAGIPGAIHLPHPARTEHRNDFVGPEVRARG